MVYRLYHLYQKRFIRIIHAIQISHCRQGINFYYEGQFLEGFLSFRLSIKHMLIDMCLRMFILREYKPLSLRNSRHDFKYMPLEAI